MAGMFVVEGHPKTEWNTRISWFHVAYGPTHQSREAPLREALFMAANAARRTDPTLAARYHRLMVHQGKHHNSALCHISTTL